MEIYQVRQFSEIEAERRNPSLIEHNKFLKWNNNSEKFDYKSVSASDIIDIDIYIDNYFITHPSTDDYLVSVSRKTGVNPNYAKFVMHTSGTKYLPLGALAWLDEIPITNITLPGDQMVLFDEVIDGIHTFGGRTAFKYNYPNNYLNFQGTSLNFDKTAGTEGSYKEGLSYRGLYSFNLGHGVHSSTSGGSYNITAGYRAGHSLATDSIRNTMLGPRAGEQVASDITDCIFVGAYAGKYETASYKFFLDSIDYSTTVDAQNGSFLYADLLTERRLYIRDRLSVEAEGKFGDSGIPDGSGEAGMLQMKYVSEGVVAPEWYSDGIWNSFATSVDKYLEGVTYIGGNLTFTMSDASTIGPVDISALNVQPFATSPSSPSTGITATSDYGYLQLSNSAFTNDRGFTHRTGLKWNNTIAGLEIPGVVKLDTRATYAAENGVIRYDETLKHFYGRLDAAWKQLDNDEPSIDNIDGINIGGATYEVFKQRTLDDLEFRTFQGMEIDSTYNPYDRITFKYSSTGDAILIGTTAERNRLSTTVDDQTIDRMIDKPNEGETLHIRALREGDNIVLTETANYIRIDATTGGTATLMNGANLGDYDLFAQRNGTNLEFYGITSTDAHSRILLNQGATDVEFALDLTIVGDTETKVSVTTYDATVLSRIEKPTGTKPKIWFKPIISNDIIITTTVNDEILLELPESTTTPTITCVNVGRGDECYEVYVEESTAPFEFRTLRGFGDLTITQNIDGEHLDFTVNIPDLTYTYNGTVATAKELLVGTAGSEIISKGVDVTTTSGLTLSESTVNDIIIDQPILIQQLGVSGSDVIETTTNSISSRIIKNFLFSEDVRDGSSPTGYYKFFDLLLGGGLLYNVSTNTLSCTVTDSGTGDDYALRTITDISDSTDYVFSFDILNGVGDPSAESPLYLSFPKPVPPVFPDIINVDESTFTHELDITPTLVYDVNTNTIGYPNNVVTYTAQNELHDEDNLVEGQGVNPQRILARANIGAAYVNGAIAEDFSSKSLTVKGTYAIAASEGQFRANSTTARHELGDTRVVNSTIFGRRNLLTLSNSNAQGENKIDLTPTYIKFTIPAGTSKVDIYDSNGVHLFKLDSNGDLYIKGSIHAGGTIEGFDSNLGL